MSQVCTAFKVNSVIRIKVVNDNLNQHICIDDISLICEVSNLKRMNKTQFSLLFFLIVLFCKAQDSLSTEIYTWYDTKTVSERSYLYRGIEYSEKDRMLNDKHKFFETNAYKIGQLTYDGQVYNDVPMNYNIYDDLLLVNIEEKLNNFFQLFSDKVEAFSVLGHDFKNITPENNGNIQGFYEVIDDDEPFKIYKKHILARKRINDVDQFYFEFTAKDSEYIYEFNGDYHELNQSKDLVLKLPEHEKEIKDFFRDNSKVLRKTPDIFMSRLAKKINLILNNSQETISK
jgi:hypothetical protein